MKTAFAILLLVPSIACAQGRGGMMTISPDGAMAVASPAVRATVRTTSVRYGYYPVRGNHWTYPGNSRGSLIRHLQSGEHSGKFSSAWLNSLSYQALLSLHDDDHEHRVKRQNRYVAAAVVPVSGYRVVDVPLSASTVRAIDRADRKAEKDLGRAVWSTRDGKHPGPVGGWIRGTIFGDPRYRSYRSGGCPNGRCPL